MKAQLLTLSFLIAIVFSTSAQPMERKVRIENNKMTPEMLLTLNRVSGMGLTEDNKEVVYAVSKVLMGENKKVTKYFKMNLTGGGSEEIEDPGSYLKDDKINKDGTYRVTSKEVKVKSVLAQDFHKDVKKANVYIYEDLNYRHWDKWEDGKYGHVMIEKIGDEKSEPIDIMRNEPYDCPQQPFGGSEDYIWHPDGDKVLYVTKKLEGKEYAISTNSDIYQYNMKDGSTTNLTKSNKGYDNSPAFSSKGNLAWLQMKRDGYESDKNDIIVRLNGKDINLTGSWDGTVYSFVWSDDGSKIYFNAPTMGTVQLYEVAVGNSDSRSIRQITTGQFDINGLIGQAGEKFVVHRRDMNHATELYLVNLNSGAMRELTTANQRLYRSINMSRVEKRMIPTTDGKEMLTWVIYPPNFDPEKKYPTLLYCQGGPQGALSQFYSYRWNFQLMAAQGYIVVAPNRRGMPGFGVEWNEQISGDYGGQNMQDYLSAIDALAKEEYVDNDRLGCVGASYGGYSTFYLAAIHENRFKTFISHDGIFNWKSMYGTTEEMFFVNWDLGGNYWDKDNLIAQKSYNEFNPVNKVNQWSKPILIIQGGLDYRVPIGQGLEAFQAAQLQGIKSKLLYFPEENHWVLSSQNALVWQREFFTWLKETL